jgi:hypothetical protein
MKAVEIHNQNLTLVKPHTARAYQFMALDEQALDEDYLTMDVSRRESQFLQNYVLAMDLYYDACCDAITDEFYGPGLLMSNIGYKHFPDTVNISMPSAMKAGVKERVEVTLNKKYFNKMIDSLKNAGVLNFESRPFYKGIVKLESDDLVIEKLNNDRQVISELDYTTWRFDISSSETGVKKMKGSVGLIVLDSSDKEKVIYIPLRLRAIEAL